MIKNVVFDFGMVLVSFVPDYMVRQYIKEPEEDEICVGRASFLHIHCLTSLRFFAIIHSRISEGNSYECA